MVVRQAVVDVCTFQQTTFMAKVVAQRPSKRFWRYFKLHWQVGRPWLQYAKGVMWCLACKEYPQLGVQQTWLTGNSQLRIRTMIEHQNCGVHCKSLGS